jgi:hypothetical protein
MRHLASRLSKEGPDLEKLNLSKPPVLYKINAKLLGILTM